MVQGSLLRHLQDDVLGFQARHGKLGNEAAEVEGFDFAAAEADLVIEGSLRPRSLAEYIGQQEVKANLSVLLQAATGRGEAADHILLYGPPGLGKTTLATIIARELGVNVRYTSGPAVERPGDLAAFMALGITLIPLTQARAQESCSKVVVVALPGVTWADVDRVSPPNILAVAEEGAVGSVAVRTISSRAQTKGCRRASIGTES